ncbi:MAG TPA: SUMF1/EgtB/PvdO family nonheme iron enzyme [Bacteroidales bacterium]|nr:SUMF1/EgtB/PvdO family nonheme iron enzyme [Bacteroidales bacterium]
MKYIILICFVSLLSLQAKSQITSVKPKAVKSPKGMKFIPPGMCSYNGGEGLETKSIQGFWMSNEITNQEFRMFYEDIKANPDSMFIWFDIKEKDKNGNYKTDSIRYSEILDELIDVTVWKHIPEYENYFTDKAFDKYPVTGINYKSAMYYCWWISKKENEKNKDKKYLVEYRLPLEIEWVYAAYSGTDEQNNAQNPGVILNKAKSGKANEYGLYNMYGNANEFVLSSDYKTVKIIVNSDKNTNPGEMSKTVDKNYSDNLTGFRIVRTFLGNLN